MFMPLVKKFIPLMTRFALFADVISIPLLSFFLKFQLLRLQSQGLLDYYRIDLRKIGKFYYELNLHLVLGSVQTERLLTDLFAEALDRTVLKAFA